MEIDDLIKGLGKKQSSQTQTKLLLQKTWVAERMCPEILPFAEDQVQGICDEIKQLVEYIETHSYEIENSTNKDIKIVLLIVETELERLKYLVRSYLRTRISKIDQLIAYYSIAENQQNLTQQEQNYATSHIQLQFDLYRSSFMAPWPERYQEIQVENNEKLIDAPELAKPVVVRTLQNTYLGEDEAPKGALFITRYELVRDQLGVYFEIL